MTDVLVIGASGQIAKKATLKLLDAGFSVRALVRDAKKMSDIQHDSLEIYEKDLENDFSDAVNGVKSVVFSAGSGANTGADKTMLIDLWAARNAIEYSKQANVQNFLMVSGLGAQDPDTTDSPLKPYLVAKHMADEHLINSGLHYIILRPGTLTDNEGNGKVTETLPDNLDDATIPRDDVATSIVCALQSSSSENRIVPLYKGEQDISSLF